MVCGKRHRRWFISVVTGNTSSSWSFLELMLFPGCSLCCDSLVQPCPVFPLCMLRSWCLNWSSDQLEPNDSAKGGWAAHTEYAILLYTALSTALQDYQGAVHRLGQAAASNLCPWSHLGLSLFSAISLPLKNIRFGCACCVLGGIWQITAVLCCVSLNTQSSLQTSQEFPSGQISQLLNCRNRLTVHFGYFLNLCDDIPVVLEWDEEGMESSWEPTSMGVHGWSFCRSKCRQWAIKGKKGKRYQILWLYRQNLARNSRNRAWWSSAGTFCGFLRSLETGVRERIERQICKEGGKSGGERGNTEWKGWLDFQLLQRIQICT